MILLPKLNPIKTTREKLDGFRGIDTRPGAPDYSLCDSRGLNPTAFPFIKSGMNDVSVKSLTDGDAFYAGEKFFISDGELYKDTVDTGLSVEGEVSSAVKIGDKVVLFPQKSFSQPGNHGSLENTCTYNDAVFTLCRKDGMDFPAPVVSGTQPQNQSDGDYWLDTSGEEAILRRCTMGVYYSVDSTYIHIQRGGIGVGFNKGDGVHIEGSVINGDYIIEDVYSDRIIVAGIITSAATGSITVSRNVPDISFADTAGNRVYGAASDGSAIYVSALGRPDGFNIFEGLASDSYAADVVDGSPFTAVSAYMGEVYFFKENMIYVLKGTKPSNYTLSVINAKGVKAGCHKSVIIAGGIMYYYGTDGFYSFDGTYPQRVFLQFTNPLENAVCASLGDVIYVSAAEGFYGLNLRYNTVLKISGKAYKNLMNIDDALYYCTADAFGSFNDDSTEFSMTFSPLGLKNDSKSAVNRINLSLRLGIDSDITVSLSYDGNDYKSVYTRSGNGNEVMEIPIMLRPHRTLGIKIEGRGKVEIYSMSLYRKETSPCRM